jgi:hypothetical protein
VDGCQKAGDKPVDQADLVGVLGLRFLKSGHLLGRCLGLVFGLPLVIGHAVDHPARLALSRSTPASRRIHQPVGQAVAAKPGLRHQIDVLHIGALCRCATSRRKAAASRSRCVVSSIEFPRLAFV